mmetsp:Transcript_18462/g.30080  ORF Transcript_18462/g.30080 Transcript_18462/m.30080 type:complete len:613 (-) Transcript_18462:8250-10088(-)
MPTALSATSIGYSNRKRPRACIYPSLISSTAAADSRITTLAKRENPSSTNMPLNAILVPSPVTPIQAASAINTAAVAQSRIEARPSLAVYTAPSRPNMAKIASRISGRMIVRSAAIIQVPSSVRSQLGRGLCRGQGRIILCHKRRHRGADDVEDQGGIDAQQDRHHHQRGKDRALPAGHVGDRLQAFLDQVAHHDPAVQPQRIGRRENHTGRGHCRDPCVHLEHRHQCQEFTHKPGGSRQAHIGHGEQHKDKRIGRHPVYQTAIGVDIPRVHPVIDHAHTKEERARNKPVREHLENRPINPLLVRRKNTHGHKTHMSHGRIGNQLFHVFLHQRHQRGVDNRNRRHPQHQRRQNLGAHREHRDRKTQEAIATHLQQDRRQNHGPRRRGLNVRVRQPRVDRPHRHLDRKAGKEGDEQQRLHAPDDLHTEQAERLGREIMGQKLLNIGGARIGKHADHGHQHQDRPKEGIKEELERRIDAVRPTPDPDDQEHRDQPRLKEEVEQHQIQRHEHAQHERFQQQESDHVFLDARGHVPRGRNHQRHHEGGQHHKQNRNPVNAHFVLQAQQPLGLFHELEAGVVGVKLEQDKQRHQEGGRGGKHRNPFGIALRRLVLAP